MRLPLVAVTALAATAMLTAPATAQTGPQWQSLVKDQDGETLLDPASVKHDGQRVTVDIRTTLSQPMNNMSRIDATMLLDCTDRSAGYLAANLYDPSGTLMGSRKTDAKNAEMKKADADSVNDALLKKLCPAR